MKTLILRLLSTACVLGLLLTAHAQTDQPPADSPPTVEGAAPPPPEQAAPMTEAPPGEAAVTDAPPAQVVAPVSTEAAAEPEEKPAVPKETAQETPTSFTPPTTTANGAKQLHLNFRNAPIEMVLSYLSDAAGFIIELNTTVRGKVDVWSTQPVSKEEAIDILNSVLNKNGFAAIRNGRRLTIVSKEDAVRGDIPVRTGNDPASVPKNDELVTQIIPIRYVEAEQLVKDLSSMVSVQRIIANEAGNSIAVTDTQANIRHLMELIKAIDSSAEDVTELRVFHLEHADPTEMATLLNGLFSGQGSSTTAQAPVQFGQGRFGGFGGGGFGGGGFGGGGGGNRAAAASTGNAQSQRIKKRQQVVAVADARTSSVVVTATKDLIDQIGDMIQELDHHSPKESSVQVFHLNNADPQQVLPVLQDMFQNSSTARNNRNTATQNSPLMNRIQQNQNSGSYSGSSIGTGVGNGGRTTTPQF